MAQPLPPTKMDLTGDLTEDAPHYGGIDPENEDNFPLVPSVSDNGLRDDATDRRKILVASTDHYYPLPPGIQRPTVPSGPRNGSCPILKLPVELIDSILAYLSPVDLVAVSATCRKLNAFATAEIHWLHRVQANVPGVRLTSPHPCATYQELYGAHDPRWFLPKYKIWFCDRELVGKLILVRYDPRRGCIEGYQLLAVSDRTTFHHWPADHNVVIHAFEPRVVLHLDKPVLQFDAGNKAVPAAAGPTGGEDASEKRRKRFAAESPMHCDNQPDLLRSNFMLARPLSPEAAAVRLATPFPYGNVWPPPAIPARHRVAGLAAPTHPETGTLQDTDQPTRRAEASDQAFRTRQWMEMTGPSSPPLGLILRQASLLRQMMSAGVDVGTRLIHTGVGRSVHVGEEIITYSTLDPKLYTPTELKPWRGIWVGDYSGHGCEFLLMNQPDEDGDDASDEELGLERGFDESDESWEARRRDARVYRGRLEAIKLTGDHNVPRGEYTFVADDLGEKGFVGVAREEPFAGTRVVKSRGHVAGAGFLDDKYIESQLLLVSHDRLAQYWVGFGHISFFERVDIDRFLVP